MAKRKTTAGIASVMLPISIADTSSTTGGGLAGLVFNTAGLVAEYRRQGQSAWTAITLVAGTLGTYVNSGGAGTGGGFVADGALAGDYELCAPNACFVAGARWVIIRLRGAANMLPVRIEIELDAIDYQDGIRGGMVALPAFAANAAGGLPVSIAGGLDLDALNADVDATETRVLLALPAAAPQAAGGLITSTAGALDVDEMNSDIETIVAGSVDPWATPLPGAYPAGQAGYVVGHNLDSQVSLRLLASAYTDPTAALTTLLANSTLQTGLAGHNSGVRNETRDGSGNLLSADLCIYDTAPHATTNDGVTGLQHKYSLVRTYSGGFETTQSMAAVS